MKPLMRCRLRGMSRNGLPSLRATRHVGVITFCGITVIPDLRGLLRLDWSTRLRCHRLGLLIDDHDRRRVGVRIGINRFGIEIPDACGYPPPSQMSVMMPMAPMAATPDMQVMFGKPVNLAALPMPVSATVTESVTMLGKSRQRDCHQNAK